MRIKGYQLIGLAISVVVLMTFAAAWLVWLTFSSSNGLIQLQERQSEMARLQGIVLHHDEVLTMSARMAAATGSPQWELRYRKFEPELLEAIQRLISLEPAGLSPALATDEANTRLVEMENLAFERVRQGRRAEASRLLFSAEYEKQKEIYLRGMSELHESARLILERERESYQARVERLQTTLPIFLTLCFLGWGYVFYVTRQWNIKLKNLNAHLETQVQEKTSKLVLASKMSALGEMAGGIAHEINTPLAVIKSLSSQLQELLRENVQDRGVLTEMAVTVEKTTDRIAQIVQGLRFFSRDGSQDVFDLVNVEAMIRDTMQLCQERFRNHDIRLKVEPVAGSLCFEGRAVEISQVLLNLLNNAFDAILSKSERWVEISAHEKKGWIELTVTDSGEGISPELQKKIFQPFFTTKEVGKGTGLGLSISLGIVQSHHGEILLDSSCRNTRFVLRLPQKQPQVVN